jgi:PEP-CTERM motif
MKTKALVAALVLTSSLPAYAALVTDPNDARSWQGATVGTFAQLFFGSNTLANRQQVIDKQLLDDGLFNTAGYNEAPLTQCNGCTTPSNLVGQNVDTDGINPYEYIYGDLLAGNDDRAFGGSHVDSYWIQTGNTVGGAIWDLGQNASTAIIFNSIDHGPMPQEAIESTVYLSNDQVTWVQAVTQRVWLEGYVSNTAILWDGFTYAVGTPDGTNFRYASIIWGGDGALLSDGDNEINGVMGATRDFEPPDPDVPVPGTLGLLGLGLAGLGILRRRKV